MRDLVAYFRDPARHLLERHARAKLDALDDDGLEGEEPLAPTLSAFDSVARRLFREGAADDTAPDWLRLSGRLPSGALGEAAWQHEAGVLRDIRAAAEREGVAPGTPRDIPVDLVLDIDAHALPLQGHVRNVFERAEGGLQLLGIPVGNKGLKKAKELGFRHYLPLFIEWLALRLATPADVPVRIAMLCDEKSDGWAAAINDWDVSLQAGHASLDGVRARLTQLVGWWLEAPQHPLRWFPDTAQAAVDVPDPKDMPAVEKAVRDRWLGNWGAGERDRAPGANALLAGNENFDAGSPALHALIDFARQLDACLHFASPKPAEGDA